MNIAILPNLTRENARETTREICAQLQKLGACAMLEETVRPEFAAAQAQFLPQKDVAEILGHSEKVNEMYYNYSTADVKEKKTALSSNLPRSKSLTLGNSSMLCSSPA